MTRPEYPAHKLTHLSPEQANAIASAARSNHVVTLPDGRSFWFKQEAKAQAFHARHGGALFPPVA